MRASQHTLAIFGNRLPSALPTLHRVLQPSTPVHHNGGDGHSRPCLKGESRMRSRIALGAVAGLAVIGLALSGCSSQQQRPTPGPARSRRQGQDARRHDRRQLALPHRAAAVVQGCLGPVPEGDRRHGQVRDVRLGQRRAHQDPDLGAQRPGSRHLRPRHHLHPHRVLHRRVREAHGRRLEEGRRPRPVRARRRSASPVPTRRTRSASRSSAVRS